jgi:hypothetical protein
VRYRYVGDHAIEIPIGDTRVQVGPGDFIEMDSIAEEMESVFIEAPESASAKAAPADTKGVSNDS